MRPLLLALLSLAFASAVSAQARWTSRNPAPTAANLNALAGGNGLYVAVGGSGLILTSTDGVSWETSTLFTKENLNNISYAGGSFFARGDSGTVFVSADGKTWHQRVGGNVSSSGGPTGHAAAYGNGAWVLVGSSYQSVITSSDATTFTPRPELIGSMVAFGAGHFLLHYGSSFATSPDGVTFTVIQTVNLDAASEFYFGAGQFIARRFNNLLYRSSDGITWTEIPGVNATALTFAKDRFIAQSATTGGPIISLDGITWTAPTDSVISIPPSHIASNGDNFAAFVGHKLYTSTDALHWTQRGTDFTSTAFAPSLAFAAGRYLTNDGYTSTDGLTWTATGFAVPTELAYDCHLHAANDRFFIFSNKSIYTSADGLTGQQLTSTAITPRAIVYGAGRYVMVGYRDGNDVGGLATSVDGLTWTEQSLPSGTPILQYVAYANNLFVATGSAGSIYTSPDGLAWTLRPHSVDSVVLNNPVYGAGRWVIAGIPCLTSTDGILWSRASAPDATTITFANGTFVLSAYTSSASNTFIPAGYSIVTSSDGEHWTWRDSDRLSANQFVYGAGSWVGVGAGGRLIQSSATDFAKAPAFASGLTARLDPADLKHLTLTAPATGAGPISYQWSHNGATISGATTDSIDYADWTRRSGDLVRLIVTNDYGTSIASYQISYRTTQLNPADTFGPISFSARHLPDGRLKLNGTSDYDYNLVSLGLGPIQFQWFKNGSAIPDANGPNITIPFDPAVDADSIYSLRITNLFGSVFFDRPLQPVVLRAPSATQASLGERSSLLMEVSVPHLSGDVTFTWTKDGQVVKTDTIGASSYVTVMDVLDLSAVTAADYGLYQVTVTTAFGTVASNYFTVSAPRVTRLTNLSVRAKVGTGDDVLIAGYVGSGSTGGPNVLLRGIGPTLATLGVATPLPRAHLNLNNAAGVSLATNEHWDASPGYDATFLRDLFAQLGAFTLNEGSFNAALLRPGSLNTSQPPRFTAVLSGVADTTGVGMIEIYESVATGQRLLNLSARARVGSGENILIAGFVIDGEQPLKVLIRGVGPGLANQGVSAPLTNPKITLYNAAGEPIHNNDNWSDARNLADLRAATTTVGAFALTDGSHDAAMLETLAPGVYSVHVTSADATTGIALVEIYAVP